MKLFDFTAIMGWNIILKLAVGNKNSGEIFNDHGLEYLVNFATSKIYLSGVFL
jgi:hypothetical protein